MNSKDYQAMALRLERLAAQAAESLERQMAEEEPDPRRSRELTGLLKDALSLARELRGQEARELRVCFIGDSEAAGV